MRWAKFHGLAIYYTSYYFRDWHDTRRKMRLSISKEHYIRLPRHLPRNAILTDVTDAHLFIKYMPHRLGRSTPDLFKIKQSKMVWYFGWEMIARYFTAHFIMIWFWAADFHFTASHTVLLPALHARIGQGDACYDMFSFWCFYYGASDDMIADMLEP